MHGPRPCAGASSTPRDDSSTGHASASCASSTAGPAQMRCSMPTNASRSSPDLLQRPARRHQVDDARPERPSGSLLTTENGCNADTIAVKMPESVDTPLRQPDPLPHVKSLDSRERSGLATCSAGRTTLIEPCVNITSAVPDMTTNLQRWRSGALVSPCVD